MNPYTIDIIIAACTLVVIVGTAIILLRLRFDKRRAELLIEEKEKFLRGALRRHNKRVHDKHDDPLAERIKKTLPYADNVKITNYYEPTIRVISER